MVWQSDSRAVPIIPTSPSPFICDPSPSNVDGSYDLLLINSVWQRLMGLIWLIMYWIMLYKIARHVLLADSFLLTLKKKTITSGAPIQSGLRGKLLRVASGSQPVRNWGFSVWQPVRNWMLPTATWIWKHFLPRGRPRWNTSPGQYLDCL